MLCAGHERGADMAAPLRLLMVLGCAAALGGCSVGTRMAYDNLDWVVRRELSGYVSLDRQQRQILAEGFARWWRWHRCDQLPRYAASLRRLADAASDHGLPPQAVREAAEAIDGYWAAAVRRALPLAQELLASLSDEQVRRWLTRIDEDIAEYEREWVGLDPARRRARRIERMVDRLEGRFGRLTSEQHARVAAWADAHEDRSQAQLEAQRRWREDFAAVLATRDRPGLAERLAPLLLDSPADVEDRAASRRNRERWVAMVVEVTSMWTPRQARRFRDRLRDLAEDFDDLSARCAGAPDLATIEPSSTDSIATGP